MVGLPESIPVNEADALDQQPGMNTLKKKGTGDGASLHSNYWTLQDAMAQSLQSQMATKVKKPSALFIARRRMEENECMLMMRF